MRTTLDRAQSVSNEQMKGLTLLRFGMKAAGFYTFTHVVTGATMLGSTASGASAAGMVGIMGSTAGAIGRVSAALMSPFVIVPAALGVGGVGIYEGGWYLKEKR